MQQHKLREAARENLIQLLSLDKTMAERADFFNDLHSTGKCPPLLPLVN